MTSIKKAALFALVTAIALSFGAANVVADDKATEAMQMVKKALTLFKEKGKDNALKVMSSPSGSTALGVRKGPLYVFAGAMENGRCINVAHPVNQALIGKDVTDLKGAKGKEFIKEMMKVVKSPTGSGWVEYYWKRHGEPEPSLKRSYVVKVPGEDMFVGVGYYVE